MYFKGHTGQELVCKYFFMSHILSCFFFCVQYAI
jgi:hypothetical protein